MQIAFFEVTVVSDPETVSFTGRKAMFRVDQCVSVEDVSEEKFNPKTGTKIVLGEPADWQVDEEPGGVVRAQRRVFVREDYATVVSLMAKAGAVLLVADQPAVAQLPGARPGVQ